jgi:hypothetical protein
MYNSLSLKKKIDKCEKRSKNKCLNKNKKKQQFNYTDDVSIFYKHMNNNKFTITKLNDSRGRTNDTTREGGLVERCVDRCNARITLTITPKGRCTDRCNARITPTIATLTDPLAARQGVGRP